MIPRRWAVAGAVSLAALSGCAKGDRPADTMGCGNGRIETGEACDDGNVPSTPRGREPCTTTPVHRPVA